MTTLSRGGFLRVLSLGGAATAAAACGAPGEAVVPPAVPAYVEPGDPRYRELVTGVNQRWTAAPAYIAVPRSTAEVVAAVQRAVDENRTLSVRSDNHAAYHLRGHTDARAELVYAALTSDEIHNSHAMVVINPVGGKVGLAAPGDTAVAQRGAIFKVLYQSLWTEPAEDAADIAWATRLFRSVYAGTGNVPIPDGRTDGCYIDYPDTGVRDQDANRSGIPCGIRTTSSTTPHRSSCPDGSPTRGQKL
ncbi:hypothetical protein [Nocardia sp. NPDC057227]|uniref:hypothetical protein n=1 Tax=Nocardia sp. NPDC057227 TaxID=3346056 RepID=UPI003630C6DF